MRRNTLFALIALAMASPALLQAQTVTGTVRDQATGDPINAAQVFIEGLDIGSLSQADGLDALPEGHGCFAHPRQQVVGQNDDL